MNREPLGIYLNIPDDELCVDLWSTKSQKIKEQSRYLLSTNILNYSVIQSFAIALRPIEMSIIKNIRGSGIYLYDTANINNLKIKNEYNNRIRYSMRINISTRFFYHVLSTWIINITRTIKYKCVKLFKIWRM